VVSAANELNAAAVSKTSAILLITLPVNGCCYCY
jgi:hypothetical protein